MCLAKILSPCLSPSLGLNSTKVVKTKTPTTRFFNGPCVAVRMWSVETGDAATVCITTQHRRGRVYMICCNTMTAEMDSLLCYNLSTFVVNQITAPVYYVYERIASTPTQYGTALGHHSGRRSYPTSCDDRLVTRKLERRTMDLRPMALWPLDRRTGS